MKFFAVAALFAGALAMPTAEIEARTGNNGGNGGSGFKPCPDLLYSMAKCVATDVAGGLVCLDSKTPSRAPKNYEDFRNICAAVGQQAACVTIPLLNLGVLCQAVPNH